VCNYITRLVCTRPKIIVVAKSEEVKTGCDLEESFNERYYSRGLMMMMMMATGWTTKC
jgi:hypothetical protein